MDNKQIDPKKTVCQIFGLCSDNMQKVTNEAIKGHDVKYIMSLRAEIKKINEESVVSLNKLNQFFGIKDKVDMYEYTNG